VLGYVGSTPEAMFLEKRQSFRDDVRYSDLVTPKTTPHLYGRVILIVTFELSTWIIIVPYTSVSAT
jgi:hypothetical protein